MADDAGRQQMDGNPSDSPVPSDADLLAAVRGGDESAYAELYNRHLAGARAAARSLVRSRADADDLVSEAFTRVLRAVRNGGGPELAFRPYLLTAVRNAFFDRTRKDQRVDVTDEVPEDLDAVLVARAAMAGEDRELIARAFANLPERWQTVLWHTEVEGRPPAEVAPMLGIAPNAVAALAYRAREGLREAYLQAHLQVAPPAECADTRSKLGGYVRDTLSNRDRGKVDQHLDTCDKCRAVLVELREVSGALRTALPPVLLGVPAAAYLHHLAAAGGKGILALFAGRPRGQQLAIGGGVAAAGVVAAVAIASALGGSPQPQVAGVTVAATVTTAATTTVATTVAPTTTRAATTTSSSSTTTTTIATTTTTEAPVVVVATTRAPTTTRAATTTTTRAATTTTSTTLPPTTTTTVPRRAALSVRGSALGPVVAGRTAYFSILVTNAGPDAGTNTRLAFTMPAGLTYEGVQGDGWSCTSATAASVTCARSTLATGASSTVLVQAAVAAGATGTPTLTVAASSDALGAPGGSSANVSLGAVEAAGPSPIFAGIRHGDITMIGNTLRTCQGGCPGVTNNNGATMVAVDVDSDVTTNASSSATLTLPAGAIVNQAWLVWGAQQSIGGVDPADYRNVQLTGPGVPAPIAYTVNATGNGNAARATTEVTQQVRASGAGVYTFGRVGMTGGYGDIGTNRSGGWTLVVQYDRTTDPLRTLVVLDGLVHIAGSEQRVALGVLGSDIPAEGAKARIGLVSWDGDADVKGDSATVTSGATPVAVELADIKNPVDDVFNSSVSTGGFAATGSTPDLPNTLGFDADLFDVTVYGGGAATLTVASTTDAIDLGLVTLSIPV